MYYHGALAFTEKGTESKINFSEAAYTDGCHSGIMDSGQEVVVTVENTAEGESVAEIKEDSQIKTLASSSIMFPSSPKDLLGCEKALRSG